MTSYQYKFCSLLFTVISVFTLAQCAKSQENSVRTGVVLNAPAIQGTAAGKIETFKFNGGDLKTELSIHPAPEVWLIFPSTKSETQLAETDSSEPTTHKVELPSESAEIISSLWKVALMSRYNLNVSEGVNGHISQQEMSKIFNAGEDARHKLKKLEIAAPDGKRTISDDETNEIIKFINLSAIDTIAPFRKRKS